MITIVLCNFYTCYVLTFLMMPLKFLSIVVLSLQALAIASFVMGATLSACEAISNILVRSGNKVVFVLSRLLPLGTNAMLSNLAPPLLSFCPF